MRHPSLFLAALSLSATATASPAFSTDWESLIGSRGPFVLETTLPPPATSGAYGAATAMTYDAATKTHYAVIGAPLEDFDEGAVYIYRITDGDSNWTLEARLTAPLRTPIAEFGAAVAIDGGTIAIGAPYDVADFFYGAVYVFVRDPMTATWTQQGDALWATASQFGTSLALRGDTLAVGDPVCECVKTFARSMGSWSPEVTLTAPADVHHGSFGFSLALTDDSLLVGAPTDSAIDTFQGSAVLYAKGADSWDELQVLRPTIDTSARQQFGYAVALADDALVIGAPQEGGAKGAAHAFFFDPATSAWREESLLRDTSGATSPRFGFSVAMSDDVLAIGAPTGNSGAVYRLHASAWVLDSVLNGDDATAFGYSVAASGDRVVVGASMAGDASQGAAMVFLNDRIFADGME